MPFWLIMLLSPEHSLLAVTGDMGSFIQWYCKKQGLSSLTSKDLEGPAYKIVKAFHSDINQLQFQMEECHKILMDQVDDVLINCDISKPLPLGGGGVTPGNITIQAEFFFNKDLEYLRYGKECKHALSITKMKAANYRDIGLEQLVPDQIQIDEECQYDRAASFAISHWQHKKKEFYIDRYTAIGNREAVRSTMQILGVVRVKIFPMYGYDYLKQIVLRRADSKEYEISEGDCKHLHPSDFEDLYLLHLKGKLHHLPPFEKKTLAAAVIMWIRGLVIRQRVTDLQLGIESYQTKLYLTRPQWAATDVEFEKDFTVLDIPKAMVFRDKCNVQILLRIEELHKFSDGTLEQVEDAMDTKIKEYKIRHARARKLTESWNKTDFQ